jgi:ATP-binding cassette subfamily A (ABC1) protein 3
MGFFKQVRTLAAKNLLIAVRRHPLPTSIRTFILPVAFMIFLTYSRFLFAQPNVFGIGPPRPIRSLEDGMVAATNGRDKVIFIDNGYNGGDIDRVIDAVSAPILAAGKNVTRLPDGTDLAKICRTSFRGITKCYGAVEFASSPSEGPYGRWNYSLRFDGALGSIVNMQRGDNDHQIYALPLQRAVDSAIASVNTTIDHSKLPKTVMEFPYTTITEEERKKLLRTKFQRTIITALGIAFLLAMVGVVYHLSGFMATERDIGMSQLIEAMMPNEKRWQPQIARLLSYHLSFTVLYAPGWFVMGVVLSFGLFTATAPEITVLYHILLGLSLTSWSYMGGAFFKRAQLSGITITIITLVLGIIAQAFGSKTGSGGLVMVLSALFAPCNYVWFMMYIARFEEHEIPANLNHNAPDLWKTKGTWFFVFLFIQIFAYAAIGVFVERWLHGTQSKGRTTVKENMGAGPAQHTVELSGFTKEYPAKFMRRMFRRSKATTVTAVNGLSLSASKGEIMVLLGANGSGKSTTLDAIAGMNPVTSGTITVNGTGGIGICPQKNVLWPELTARDHIRIFSNLKSTGASPTKEENAELIRSVDLDRKIDAKSHTLSGGQKRKLQLGMMLTGGSAVCCVDEVSSGLDPLSRRKIWDILLAERGARTIILTTHFLDEADLLADRIAILSKGTLRAEGSSVELKSKLGGGYRVHLHTTSVDREFPTIDGITAVKQFDQITYKAATSSQAALIVKTLESHGIEDYELSGPTIEDVFLQLADEIRHESETIAGTAPPPTGATGASDARLVGDNNKPALATPSSDTQTLDLMQGRPIGLVRQGWVMFRKRLTLIRRNFLPPLAVFFIPIICASLVTRLVKDQKTPTCSPVTAKDAKFETISNQYVYDLIVGPSSKFAATSAVGFFTKLFQGLPEASLIADYITDDNLHIMPTYSDFNKYIDVNHQNVTPGGFWLGNADSAPTITYQASHYLYSAIFAQNILGSLMSNITVTTQFRDFESPWQPGTGNSLQLVVYFGLVCAAVPAFFSLYPTLERLRHVRGLEYSNGVRPAPLWFAYLIFDWVVFLVSLLIVTVIFAALSKVWYHIPYLFVVLLFYSLASIQMAYIVSLYAKGQLASFAIAAGSQAIFFLLYLIAFMAVNTFLPVDKVDKAALVVHYTISLVTPMGSLVRALFVSMNLFQTTCVGFNLSPNPGSMNMYGAPILYLAVQSVVFFLYLLWHDSDSVVSRIRGSRQKLPESDEVELDDRADKLSRIDTGNSDGLRVRHLTKSFKKFTAVENLSFAVERGEVFALLGPNGAGKSTTISLIRGDIRPSKNGGNIYVDDILISKHRAKARLHLGVCPQFDAIDQLTVAEHLRFYARVRGVPDIEHNVAAITTAVGLDAFSHRMAAKLSGGNKRKLSLGIALMGNPSVLLLDEPSSGMDAAAKRVMWRTLANVSAGRAILLTTHSMEEAGALASRAGIMAKCMLALGTTDHLRRAHGDAYHVHLVTTTAPHTSPREMAELRDWVVNEFPGASIEEKTYHGQMRFSVPTASLTPDAASGVSDEIEGGGEPVGKKAASGIGALIMALEERKAELGLEYYSVSPTTLDQVFLAIVSKNNVEEENYAAPKRGLGIWEKIPWGKKNAVEDSPVK